MGTKAYGEQANLQSFISCLHYLCEEAKRESQDDVADILVDTITEIEEAKNGNQNHPRVQMLDRSIYYALEFLGKYSLLPQNKKQEVLRILDKISCENCN